MLEGSAITLEIFCITLALSLPLGLFAALGSVMLLGPVPTPAVAYLARAQRADLGVVISASHNPFADNGIKFFSAQGNKLPDAWELAVEQALDEIKCIRSIWQLIRHVLRKLSECYRWIMCIIINSRGSISHC